MLKFKKIQNPLIKGAFVISIGGLITKVLGAFYRIPLTNLLGAEGIGIYQMVFPLYSLLLTVSSTGVPSGISKIIAEGEDADSVLKTAVKTFGLLGVLGSLFMLIFSKNLAILQGNIKAKYAYTLISPSVFLVSIISCFRGYFQGKANMKPTAFSQVLEQGVKLTFGLILVSVFRKNILISSALAVLSVTLSELITVIYFIVYKRLKFPKIKILKNTKISTYSLIKRVLPIIFSTLILPLTKTIESFFVINILNEYLTNATSLYGLYSGAVESLVGLPVSLCYGLAITSIPVIASLKKSGENYTIKSRQAVTITLSLSIVCGVGFYVFSPLAVKVLYSNLSSANKILLVNMLKLSSLSVIFLPLMQTLTAILIGLGKARCSNFSCAVASIVKIILSIILLKMPTFNVFALLSSDIICYLLACLLNLVYIIKDELPLKSGKLRSAYE